MIATAAPSFFCPPGEPSVAQTLADVRELASWITNRDRTRPVVVVTVRNKEHDPFFHPDDVLPLVDGAGDVVAIRQVPKSKLTVELSRLLPDGMSVYNGAARIYWPIDVAGSHPSRHPLILADGDDAAPAEKRARLAGRWRQPPLGLSRESPAEPPRNGSPALVRARPVRPTASPTRPPASAVPASTLQTPSAPTPGPRPVRPSSATPDPPMPAPSPAPARPSAVPAIPARQAGPVGAGDDELRLGITRAWLTMLPDPADRNRFGLQPFRLHRELAAQIEIHEPARSAVAAAAARIISGYAWTQVAPIPRRVEQGGAPILRDGDHAVGWRYPLPDDDRFLFYWQPAVGPVVLARIGAPDHTELPEAAPIAPRNRAKTDTKTPHARPDDAATEARISGLERALEAQRLELERLTAERTVRDEKEPQELKPAAPAVAATPPARKGNAARRGLDIADVVLVAALRDAGEPLSSRDIRKALGVDPKVPGHHITRMLNRAIASGVIHKTGDRAGARYTVV